MSTDDILRMRITDLEAKLASLESINHDVEMALGQAMTALCLWVEGDPPKCRLRVAIERGAFGGNPSESELWLRADVLLMGSDGNGGNMPVEGWEP